MERHMSLPNAQDDGQEDEPSAALAVSDCSEVIMKFVLQITYSELTDFL